ncbi:rhomboid family intramembrane serine protease [Knoellia sp. p5-6-4]|uniref:rhomboid family intramembrane serine protease n=1 Tax=unclassified Knoellia TaxID=2618719 RepID=UPI0023DB78D6|nr:rhomboid family intramembrane serine protease [Knoellia sp. p5-6-4]MDF2145051.1 rhomboid family intramembrane serine protease [Knoellia sp. p5-6-4]
MSEPTAYQQQAPPVCPRHPDRVSYVRCQRCGRPTCPECQRTAAVGVQCVDCVKAQAATMRSATTVFGGRVTDRPVVTITIVVLCVLVWIAQQADARVTAQIWFIPALGEEEPYRFLSSAFAHAPRQIMHIVFNMLALWLVGGQYLEPLLGRLRYAVLYFLSAIGGSVMLLLLAQPPSGPVVRWEDLGSWGTPAVGASGAVFGLFGALLVLNRKLGRSSSGMYATLVINAVLGFVIPSVAWQAHLGGFLTGIAVAAVFAATQERTKRRWQWPGVALVGVVVVVAALAKYALAPDLGVTFALG